MSTVPSLDPGPDAESVCVLTDYDNVFSDIGPTDEAVNARIDDILRWVLADHEAARQIDMRLYGGWLQEGMYTQRASQVMTATAARSTFSMPHPKLGGILRGSIQLATRLLVRPDVELEHTLRPRAGIPRFILSEGPFPSACGSRNASCSMRELKRLTAKSNRRCAVVDCAVTTDQAFRVREQKMVDTLICCDALHLVEIQTPVVVATGDIDVVPALLMAASRDSTSVRLYKPGKYASNLYDDVLLNAGVGVRYLEHA